MSLACECPLPSVLPNQIDVTCPVDFDQITRLAFQLRGSTPSFVTGDPISDVDSWSALLSASGATKVVLSPALSSAVIPQSEATYEGENANDSINGLGFYLGENNVRVTAMVVSAPQAVMDALEELSCYSDTTLGASKLTAFMFTRRIKGKAGIIAKQGASADQYSGIEIFNLRVSSVGSEGYKAKNKYMISFDVQPDELKGTELVRVDWNPLLLANVASV
jgi:hypothetical protein